jgi:hypothetical protein
LNETNPHTLQQPSLLEATRLTHSFDEETTFQNTFDKRKNVPNTVSYKKQLSLNLPTTPRTMNTPRRRNNASVSADTVPAATSA